MTIIRTLTGLLLLTLVATPASAGKISSAYTKLDLKKCKTLNVDTTGTGWVEQVCKGYDGIDVNVAAGDLRYYVSFGPNAKNQIARGQTISPFNHVHHTLEWRVEQKGGKWVPFATILRYFWGADGLKGQVLVVTRLEGDEACHVAHIKADGNPKANVQARQAADTIARTAKCATHDFRQFSHQ